jgi:hypothetical protein
MLVAVHAIQVAARLQHGLLRIISSRNDGTADHRAQKIQYHKHVFKKWADEKLEKLSITVLLVVSWL